MSGEYRDLMREAGLVCEANLAAVALSAAVIVIMALLAA
jgi:hypothetical protein